MIPLRSVAVLALLCQCAAAAATQSAGPAAPASRASPASAPGEAAAAAPLRIYAMDSHPISFLQDGQPAGMVVDVAREVQRRLGRSDAVEVVPWARAITMVQKEGGVLLLTILHTQERDKFLQFTGPVFMAHITAFATAARADAIRAMGDGIKSLRTGVRRATVFGDLARQQGYRVTDEANSVESAARMLMQGRFDIWIDGEQTVLTALGRSGYRAGDAVLVRSLGWEPAYFAFSAGTELELVRAWNGALRAMKQDGSYQRIHRKWLPDSPLPPDARPAGK